MSLSYPNTSLFTLPLALSGSLSIYLSINSHGFWVTVILAKLLGGLQQLDR